MKLPGVAELSAAAWRLYRSSFGALSGYLAWMLVPQTVLLAAGFVPQGPWRAGLEYGAGFAAIALSLWVTVICIRLLSGLVTGRYEAVAQAASHAGARLWPFVLAGLLQSLVGLILFLIPGIVFSVWYGFASFHAALEGSVGVASLTASRRLSAGRFWAVAWRFFTGPLTLTAWYAVGMTLVVVPWAVATGVTPDVLAGANPPMWFSLLDTLGQTFFLTPLLLAYMVLLYHALSTETAPL